jgi:hypothetical protein
MLRNKIVVTRIPISHQFCCKTNKTELFKKYKLRNDILTVFISLGGKELGADMHLPTIAQLFSLNFSLQIIVIIGENEPFRKDVKKLAATIHDTTIKVFGSIDKMTDLITISDVLSVRRAVCL